MRKPPFKLALVTAVVAVAISTLRPPRAAQAGGEDSQAVITRLIGRHQTITITATPNGPRYSVSDAKGKPLIAQVTLDELRTIDPVSYRQLQTGIVSTAETPTPYAGVEPNER